MRKILHSDLNNFYASVECLLNPQIRDLPVVVCGRTEDRHGVVLAKNMIAKSLGVKTGMVIYEAKNLCPNLVCCEARHDLYLKYSRAVKDIYREYSWRVESFGIDEAWIDVTNCSRCGGDAYKIADEIRNRVKTEIGLTVSVGVSFNKIFAKLASDIKKPDAVTVISAQNYKQIAWNLPVENLLYVGRSTQKKLASLTIKTIGDLARFDKQILINKLGKWGEILHTYAKGEDQDPVTTIEEREDIKSIGNSVTFYRDLTTDTDIIALLTLLSESVCSRMIDYGYKRARTVHLTITTDSLTWVSRCAKMRPTNLATDILDGAYKLFCDNFKWNVGVVRGLGVSISDFVNYKQLSLADSEEQQDKQKNLQDAVETIRRRFGRNIINKAIVYTDQHMCNLNIKPLDSA